MADTSSSQNPRGHSTGVVGRTRGRGRGRGGPAGERPGGAHRGRGPKPRSPGRGDSDANSDRGDDGRRRGRGRGGRGRRGSESGLGRSTASVGRFPQRRGRATEMGSERNWTARTSSRPAISNTFNSFSQRTASELSAAQMQEFLQTGLSEITISTDSRQTFVNNLATEGGLARVRQIVETDFSPSYSVLNPMFDPHCILFLHLISHEEIRHSLVLEKAIGTIYNVVCGHDGNRGVGFFRKIANWLAETRSGMEGRDGSIAQDEILRFEEALLLATKVLLSTLTLNQGAAIKAEFRGVVEQLCGCYHIEDVNCDLASFDVRAAHETILKIKDILSMGDAISASHAVKIRTTTTSQQQQSKWRPLELDVDLPGKLSQFGPRHDNDHALISDIRILPTLSEILCDSRVDFLPTRYNPHSPSKHHETGILRLLDSQFRLLREDTSGLLRDSIRLILENWNTLAHNPDWQIKRKILRNGSPTPVRMYFDVEIRRIKSDPIKGVEVEIEFDQVRGARNSNLARRKQWWLKSQSLKEGKTILALINGEEEKDQTVIFLHVSKREICAFDHDEEHSPNRTRHVRDLASNAERAMITLRLASPAYPVDLSNLVYLTSNNRHSLSSSRPLILVEFPAVLYNSFEGVLRCLQNLHKDPTHIPFTTWLAPYVHDNSSPQNRATTFADGKIIVPPPAYLHNKDLDLSCIPTPVNKSSNSTIPLFFSPSHDSPLLSTQLSELTTLDTGQADAFVSALKHQVALIQGPPGTGKSYVGIQIARCLLKNRDLLRLGPILCVCYTGHALDQFLHELLDSGVTSILRVGAPRPSSRLEAYTLENYDKNKQIPRIRGLGKRRSDCRADLDKLSMEIQKVCKQVEEGGVGVVKGFLKKRFPVQAEGIFGGASERGGFSLDSEFETWLSGNAPGDWGDGSIERSIDQLLLVEIWTLTNSERARLYQYWHNSAFAELLQQLHDLMQKHSTAKQLLTSLCNAPQTQFLDQFHVVGVTTTGLANNCDLLRGLRAKVLICEEAGEVLEAHVLTVLLPSIEHAILIGDHLQLRPRISSLKLSMDHDRAGPRYNLDESLFERLAKLRCGDWNMNGGEGEAEGEGDTQFPIVQLDHQRRMHPAISALVRETLYPHLQDHPCTTSYPEVSGMKRRLFWLDHRNIEDAGKPDEPMQSKTNMWEAKMVTGLVRHLCRQGKYKRGEIAVLTPYVAQLRILRDMLGEVVELIIGERDLADLDASEAEADDRDSGSRKRPPQGRQQQMVGKGTLLDELRIASVDNFQGEEATIVIVSLVRSNKLRNCGFLKTPNRINVLLSRAKHGMYIIGNADTSSRVPMWSSVIQLLEKNGNIGPKLELYCSRHPNNKIYISSPDDFVIHAPEGGCAEKCGLRLSCGHSCAVKCHSTTLHKAVKCTKPCTRVRECRHVCSRKCHVPCGNCTEKFPNVELPCGHTAKEVGCQYMENLAGVKCKELVERKMPGCGHNIEVGCHESSNDVKCSHACDSLLPCGHSCQEPCWTCRQIDHGSCGIPCGRPFTTCSHTCGQLCHSGTPCSPCSRPCEVRCRHSRCPKTCSEPCPPCAEQCGWSCGHQDIRCSMPCAVPCDIIPCDRRCEKKLVACAHQCPGVCGELCPDSKFCLTCAPDIGKRTVDYIMFEEYAQINIDENPLIFLSCGHFYTISCLDGIMELNQHYAIDSQTGKIICPKPSARVVTSGSAPKGCPECRMPLRDIDRYNRVVKTALLHEATKRFITQARLRYVELEEEIQQREMKIEGESREFMLEWSQEISKSRDSDQVKNSLKAYQAEGTRLQSRINKYTKSVGKTEQPFGRVNSIFASAVARQKNTTTNVWEFDESAIQTGFQFYGECFSLRLSYAILSDFDRVCSNNAIDSRIRLALRNAVATRIKGLIDRSLSLINSCRNAKFPQQEVEARIFYALLSVLSLNNSREQGQSIDVAAENSAHQQAKESLEECETLCSQYPGTLAHLKDRVEKAKRSVNSRTLYSLVTTEEMREVYRAMAEQFSGTGHWYYCRNNHPFTVGECGMPMEEARCPQCEEPVGGQDHVPVQGVRRADDLEREFSSI